jgi:ABC-type dipeptide/oligopeptide/nickel transport system permease subunit
MRPGVLARQDGACLRGIASLANCLGTLALRISTDVGSFLAIATGLGYVGLGTQHPTPGWELRISETHSESFAAA